MLLIIMSLRVLAGHPVQNCLSGQTLNDPTVTDYIVHNGNPAITLFKDQAMRELAILTFVSLDGVMQAPKLPNEDCSGNFAQGGWAESCWDNVMLSVGKVAMSNPYDALLGRSTYDLFAPHHSGTDSPLNRATKYVVTSKPIEHPWPITIEIGQDIPSAIAELKTQNGPLLQVHGSHGLIQLLLEHDLIDEYRIWTFPIILGSGKRLFGSGSKPMDLVLHESEALSSGAVMTIYRNAD